MPKQYPRDLRERAVRLVTETRQDHDTANHRNRTESDSELALITVGDSLSLPRPGNPLTAQRAQEAWPNLLKELLGERGGGKDPLHWHLGFGGARAPQIPAYTRGTAGYLRLSGPTLVVAQFGIVDCTPRPIPLKLRQLLTTLRLRRMEERVRRNSIGYRLWGRPWTTLKRFRKAAREFAKQWENSGGQVVFLAIIPPGPQLVKIVGRDFSVENYNNVFRDLSDEMPHVHFLTVTPSLLKDGHHLSTAGHIEVANHLYQFVCNENAEIMFAGP